MKCNHEMIITQEGGEYTPDFKGGYCRYCFRDMQILNKEQKKPIVYNSHGNAKILKLWGKK